MKNKKIKLFALSAVLLLAGGAFIANNSVANNNNIVAHAEEAITISTAEDFKACFDTVGTNCNKNIVLANDIDFEGYEFSKIPMTGVYTGTFDGQGHTIKNFSVNRCLFNIIGSTGEIKNLNVIGTKNGTASGYGFLCYENKGTISNCFVSVTVNDACNTYGAFALMNNGTISNSASYMAVSSSGGSAFYSFARDAGTIIACTYNTDNTSLVAQTGTAVLDTNITINGRGETIVLPSAAINWQYDSNKNPTAVRFIGTIENTSFDDIDSVEFILSLDGVEKTVKVNTLYTSISGLSEYGEAENKYYAVYVLKGLDSVDSEGNYKYRGLPFVADFKVTLKGEDQTIVNAKEAKSFELAPLGEKLSNIVGAVVTKTDNGYICAFVDNTKASGYHIQILDNNDAVIKEQDIKNGGLIDTKGLAIGTYTIQVKAVGDGTKYFDSDYVVAGTLEVTTFVAENQLSKPVDVERCPLGDGRYICAFAHVTNASGFHIQVFDSTGAVVGEQDITNGGEITCTEGLASGTYTLKVKAVGDGATYGDSEYSDPVTFTIE